MRRPRAGSLPRRRAGRSVAVRSACRDASAPHGTDIPGSPARLTEMVKMSDRYILSGSSVFSPSRKAVVGATGAAIRSQLSKGALEIAPDERAHLLSLQIVSVVVAGREREGAEHDAPFDLGAEALRASAIVQFDIIVGGGAHSVAHPVIACQVGARLGGRDQIVSGDRVAGVGQRNFDRPRAHRLAAVLSEPRTAASTAASIPSTKYSFGTPIRIPRTSPVSARS